MYREIFHRHRKNHLASNPVNDGGRTVLLFATWNFLAGGWRYKYEGKHHEPTCEIFHNIRDRFRTGCSPMPFIGEEMISPMRVQMVRHRVKCFAVSVAMYCEIFHELPRMKVVDR